MKGILISSKPESVAKILNGEKVIDIRKTAPKCELPVEVFIYCTKDEKKPVYLPWVVIARVFNRDSTTHKHNWETINGKVVARFTLRKVEEIKPFSFIKMLGNGLTEKLNEIADKANMGWLGIHKYANGKSVYLWYIEDLEIFDEPKELSEFYSLRLDKDVTKLFDNSIQLSNGKWVKRLDKAPESWCYVEEEE